MEVSAWCGAITTETGTTFLPGIDRVLVTLAVYSVGLVQ
jgi:hypothetical protein